MQQIFCRYFEHFGNNYNYQMQRTANSGGGGVWGGQRLPFYYFGYFI